MKGICGIGTFICSLRITLNSVCTWLFPANYEVFADRVAFCKTFPKISVLNRGPYGSSIQIFRLPADDTVKNEWGVSIGNFNNFDLLQ